MSYNFFKFWCIFALPLEFQSHLIFPIGEVKSVYVYNFSNQKSDGFAILIWKGAHRNNKLWQLGTVKSRVQWNLDLRKPDLRKNLNLRKIVGTTDFLVQKLFDLRKIFWGLLFDLRKNFFQIC